MKVGVALVHHGASKYVFCDFAHSSALGKDRDLRRPKGDLCQEYPCALASVLRLDSRPPLGQDSERNMWQGTSHRHPRRAVQCRYTKWEHSLGSCGGTGPCVL